MTQEFMTKAEVAYLRWLDTSRWNPLRMWREVAWGYRVGREDKTCSAWVHEYQGRVTQ